MRFSVLILFAFVLSSCSTGRMLLTVNTKKKIENAGIKLKKVQFYNSSEIVLARGLKKEEVSVEGGKVKIENGKRIEEIIIPANTAGICEMNDERTLKVSFEVGKGRSIPFLVEKRNGKLSEESYFRIGAKEWIRTSSGKRIGKVDYKGKRYSIVRGADSRLMINRSVMNRVKRDTHVVRGRKL